MSTEDKEVQTSVDTSDENKGTDDSQNFEDTEDTDEGSDESDDSGDDSDSDEDSSSEDDATDWKAEAMKWKAIARRKSKKVETKVETKKTAPLKANDISVQEAILKAQGKSADQIAMAIKIGKLSGVDLIDALKDPLYVAWEEKNAADQAAEKRRLGASKGTGVNKKVDFGTQGLSADQHKALWKAKNGR